MVITVLYTIVVFRGETRNEVFGCALLALAIGNNKHNFQNFTLVHNKILTYLPHVSRHD